MYELCFFDTQCKSIEFGTQLEHHTLKTLLATWPFADFPYVDKENHFSTFSVQDWLIIHNSEMTALHSMKVIRSILHYAVHTYTIILLKLHAGILAHR